MMYLATVELYTLLGSEIINGKKADEKFMQYMASVQNNKIHTCGGFLVSEDFVMTAAHCLKSLSVVLGTHDLKKANKKMRYGVKMMCRHPAFKEVANGNDIMLLKVSIHLFTSTNQSTFYCSIDKNNSNNNNT
uniref:trypsin n=1 Tax=Pundamilia nyererei TaxID=303518 RepID=A0A3B4H2Q1_9CICH